MLVTAMDGARPLGGQGDQFGAAARYQICGRLGVPEEGGQQGRCASTSRPCDASRAGCPRPAVAEVVQPGTATIGAGLESSLADQTSEDVVDVLADQPAAGGRDQQAGRLRRTAAVVAEFPIVGQGDQGARVQRHLSALRKLAVPDRQDPFGGVQVDRSRRITSPSRMPVTDNKPMSTRWVAACSAGRSEAVAAISAHTSAFEYR